MPVHKRLARRSAETRRLVLEAQQLQQLTSSVEHGKNTATAVEFLDQRTKLLREEIWFSQDKATGNADFIIGNYRESVQRRQIYLAT